jgi:hypothetical protein
MRTATDRTAGFAGLGPRGQHDGRPGERSPRVGDTQSVGRTLQHANRSTLIFGDPLPGRLTSSRAKRDGHRPDPHGGADGACDPEHPSWCDPVRCTADPAATDRAGHRVGHGG